MLSREAEIEYADETSPSIYMRFELTSKPAGLESFDGRTRFAVQMGMGALLAHAFAPIGLQASVQLATGRRHLV